MKATAAVRHPRSRLHPPYKQQSAPKRRPCTRALPTGGRRTAPIIKHNPSPSTRSTLLQHAAIAEPPYNIPNQARCMLAGN
jgi:hypothetical protein